MNLDTKHFMEFGAMYSEAFKNSDVKASLSIVLAGQNSSIQQEKLILSDSEVSHYKKQIPTVRASYLLGRYAAKKAITTLNPSLKINEIKIDNGVWGFPIVISREISNMQISISHTDTAAAAIFFPERYPMGIDIERITTNNMMIIKEELTEHEYLLSQQVSIPIEDYCLGIWTAKEALAKALKTGFRIPFNFFEVSSMKKCGDLDLIRFKHFHQFESIATIIEQLKISIVFPVELETFVSKLILGIRVNE